MGMEDMVVRNHILRKRGRCRGKEVRDEVICMEPGKKIKREAFEVRIGVLGYERVERLVEGVEACKSASETVGAEGHVGSGGAIFENVPKKKKKPWEPFVGGREKKKV